MRMSDKQKYLEVLNKQVELLKEAVEHKKKFEDMDVNELATLNVLLHKLKEIIVKNKIKGVE